MAAVAHRYRFVLHFNPPDQQVLMDFPSAPTKKVKATTRGRWMLCSFTVPCPVRISSGTHSSSPTFRRMTTGRLGLAEASKTFATGVDFNSTNKTLFTKFFNCRDNVLVFKGERGENGAVTKDMSVTSETIVQFDVIP